MDVMDKGRLYAITREDVQHPSRVISQRPLCSLRILGLSRLLPPAAREDLNNVFSSERGERDLRNRYLRLDGASTTYLLRPFLISIIDAISQ
jgi:hypothetical protein